MSEDFQHRVFSWRPASGPMADASPPADQSSPPAPLSSSSNVPVGGGRGGSIDVQLSCAPPEERVLKFVRWNSRVDEEFWQRFATLKLDALGLDQKPLEIHGFFTPCSHAQIPSHMRLQFESLSREPTGTNGILDFQLGNRNRCPAPGTLYNTNTEEEFHAIDKQVLLKQEMQKVWDDICSGRAEEDGHLLNRFFLISHADLKKWRFYYWFAFPGAVLSPPASFTLLKPACQVLSDEQAKNVLEACEKWRESPSTSMPFFLLHELDGTTVRARPLREWGQCQQEGGKVLLAFYDPCNLSTNPGWPLRNLLALAVVRWHAKDLRILCYRERRGQADLEHCLIADVVLPELSDWTDPSKVPEVVGWEFNARGKIGPRMVDLASSMDPVRLATSAADLNLKLMRWRLLPSLNMPLLSATKCLLLGAGTLGCQVARGLMAWGIRHITLVDCGRVSMSNPLRQSLYTFEDCLGGVKPKAETAAENLRRIFPGVEAKGIQLAIPMPGHNVTEKEASKIMEDCSLLKELVDGHDVIFLLTDTRESRWLPTLLCANANKIAITTALGFDSYLVMRHGAGPSTMSYEATQLETVSRLQLEETKYPRLGCYFCNDVVAPEDSTMNRTLDQQCTVTRPGVAPIAAALAVELTIGILHHTLSINAPADKATPISSSTVQPLGILPHQIRGFAAHFAQLVITGNAFDKCTACSAIVVSEYRQRGLEFLLQVFNHPTCLEDLTGLTDLLLATKSISVDWEDDENDELCDIEDI